MYLFIYIVNTTKASSHLWHQVRDAAHAKIAELVTWSLRIASNGVGPDVGFRGEAFKEGTQRWNLRGKELSKGFKNLPLNSRNFSVAPLKVFWGWTYLLKSSDVLFVSIQLPRLCFFCFKADLKARKQMHVFERYYQCNLLLSCHMFSCCLIKVKTNLGSLTTFATQGSVIAAWPFKDPIAPNIWITGTLVQVRLGPSRKLMTHSIGHWMPIHCHHGCKWTGSIWVV